MPPLEGQRNEAVGLRETVFLEATRGKFDDVAVVEFALLDDAAESVALPFRSVCGLGQDRFEDCDRRCGGNSGHDNTCDRRIWKRAVHMIVRAVRHWECAAVTSQFAALNQFSLAVFRVKQLCRRS